LTPAGWGAVLAVLIDYTSAKPVWLLSRTSKSYAADKPSLVARLNEMEGQVRGIRSGQGDAHIGEVMEVIRRYVRS
jgi:hypothetical protein